MGYRVYRAAAFQARRVRLRQLGQDVAAALQRGLRCLGEVLLRLDAGDGRHDQIAGLILVPGHLALLDESVGLLAAIPASGRDYTVWSARRSDLLLYLLLCCGLFDLV